MVVALVATAVTSSQAQAAEPGWKLLGVTGPTNLPPVTNEVQKLTVDATGGTFTLSFEDALGGLETTRALSFDAPASEVGSALDELANVTNDEGAVTVKGGPGGPGGELPYFVSFEGGLGGVDVHQLTADASHLSGGAHSVGIVTTAQGAPTSEVGSLLVSLSNVGSAPTAGVTTVRVGPLPAGIVTAGPAGGPGLSPQWNCPGGAGDTTVVCTTSAVVAALGNIENVRVPLKVDGAVAPPRSAVRVSVEGGGAARSSFYDVPVAVSSQPASPGIQAFWAGAFDANGAPFVQAGGHPSAAATAFRVNTVLAADGQRIVPAGILREVKVGLPPGFIGNPMITKRCPQEALNSGAGIESFLCTKEQSQVALLGVSFQEFERSFAEVPSVVYNDVPAPGSAAEFTANVINLGNVSVLGRVRSGNDYGVTAFAPNLPNTWKVNGSMFAFEGFPGGGGGKPFLTNPTSCGAPPLVLAESRAWADPFTFSSFPEVQPAITGCGLLKFNPGFTFRTSSSEAASVTAATAHIHIDQSGLTDPAELAPPHLKKSVVTLPEGLTLNPSAANGLEACSEAQIGYRGSGFPEPRPMRFSEDAPSCPDASKLGTVEVETPLLDEKLEGTIYLAAQEENPFDSLLALYLVVDDAKTGIVLKLAGEVRPNPDTGQLTAFFDNNPQLPFEDLRLNFRGGGPRSQLATPDVCTDYATTGEWTPWSAPQSGPAAQTADNLPISSGPGGAPCPTSKAARPFDPDRTAGTTGIQAGSYSPFVLKVNRKDGEQELKRLELTLPPGLTGKLAGIDTCSQAAIDAAKAKNGRAEQANSSCPAGSRIGTVQTSAGVGSEPLSVSGTAYLAGPYENAPLSVVVVTPAVAGPFDLGTVVIRTPLFVDAKTAQLRAVSDEIPHILKGIPLQVRSVAIEMDRQDFTLNPTSCERKQIEIALTGAGGDPRGSGDDVVSRRSVPFQVGNCGALAFRPSLKVRLQGGTKRATYPRLTATVTYPEGAGYANIAAASVTLPHSVFLAQEHIRTVCTRVQFAAKACPPGSVYGHATAITPLLDQPLSGPVYLRSSNNPLPDLVAALRGPASMPIEIELSGRTDSVHSSLRNTFDLVPDAPVSKFTLQLKGGKKSLVVNSRDLCKGKKQRATARFTAQNGVTRQLRPVVQNDCKRKISKKASGNKQRAGRKR